MQRYGCWAPGLRRLSLKDGRTVACRRFLAAIDALVAQLTKKPQNVPLAGSGILELRITLR